MLTIGMPVFNDIDFIEESINSILNQTYKNFKLILSDDGSSDGSMEICLKYQKLDNRITYIRQEANLGISKNMEFLLDIAKTPYFMWAADDDLWDSNFIETLINKLEKNENAIVAFSKYYLIDEYTKEKIKLIDVNYNHTSTWDATTQFIKNSDDGFGYGIFKTEFIKGVKFPKWWWPCQKTALNNIFPSLCYYLLKGIYLHHDEVLFYKRVKSEQNTNHTIKSNNAKIELLKYIIRRFYLCVFTFFLVNKSLKLSKKIPFIILSFKHWFIKPSIREIKLGLS